jgi:hypothetical protein
MVFDREDNKNNVLIAKSTLNNNKWSDVKWSYDTNDNIISYGIYCNGIGLIYDKKNYSYITNDNGNTFSQYYTGYLPYTVDCIEYNNKELFIITKYHSIGISDDGINFTWIYNLTYRFGATQFIGINNIIYASAFDSSLEGYLWKSSDKGKTWKMIKLEL